MREARVAQHVQFEPGRATHCADGLAPFWKAEGRFHLHSVPGRTRAVGAGTGGRTERVVVRVGRKPQQAKPFHDKRLGPADIYPLPGPRQTSG